MKIGFIGQGWIGKNYADDFQHRGYEVVRYALESPYNKNKELIKECDIVFIAVPTPTTPDGFDYSIVESVLPLVGTGNIAVIKSTLTLGTTEKLQAAHPDIIVMHNPEFLLVVSAAYDAANPDRNIIGITRDTAEHHDAANLVMSVLPQAPYQAIVDARTAEMIKYARNTAGYARVIFTNILHDLSTAAGVDWSAMEQAIAADPYHGPNYHQPIHKSGRGAGGECFIKDFAAFRAMHEALVQGDPRGLAVLQAIENKNIELLQASNKDIGLLTDVYGDSLDARNDKI